MNDHFHGAHRSSEFKTAEGKILLFLVIINLIIWSVFAIIVGYTNIMTEPDLPQKERVIVYDRSL